MTKSITVRDLPVEAYDELAARAALTGRSLQGYLRLQLIELSRRADPDVLLARIRERKANTSSLFAAERVLAYRDSNRR